jgi:hypothetical protein
MQEIDDNSKLKEMAGRCLPEVTPTPEGALMQTYTVTGFGDSSADEVERTLSSLNAAVRTGHD